MTRPSPRVAAALALAAALVLAAALGLVGGCGSDDDHAGVGATATGHQEGAGEHDHATTAPAEFEGGLIEPRRTAPPLRLRDVDGETVDIRDLRGRPVLVTFVFASCPDVCPLIMENLRKVRELGGPVGKRTRVIAVSVDPEGDTVPVVRRFLDVRGVGGFVDYLLGDRPALEAAWADWQIATDAPRDDPELIEHSALIYGVTAGGELATAYPVGFDPEAIARDLPLLARS